MRTFFRQHAIWVTSVGILAFLGSGCYTQLVKPTSQESYPARDYAEAEYEEYEEAEEEEVYEEVHAQRRYYHDVHVFGYYGFPRWHDPFWDPFDFYLAYGFYPAYFYGPRASVIVGFYDPVFWCGSFWYGYDPYYDGYYGGFYGRRPYRPYYRPYYGGGFADASPPVKKRTFSRGGRTVDDDFGRLPNGSIFTGSTRVKKEGTTHEGTRDTGVKRTNAGKSNSAPENRRVVPRRARKGSDDGIGSFKGIRGGDRKGSRPGKTRIRKGSSNNSGGSKEFRRAKPGENTSTPKRSRSVIRTRTRPKSPAVQASKPTIKSRSTGIKSRVAKPAKHAKPSNQSRKKKRDRD